MAASTPVPLSATATSICREADPCVTAMRIRPSDRSDAAIESAAENFSDGLVAPLVWALLLGLPGLVAYKAINTMDSMIGHQSPRYRQFGWAAARLDDLVNLPASRLAALLAILAACVLPGASPARAWRTVRRDARRHRSPNAGWPEAAFAGALGMVAVLDSFADVGMNALAVRMEEARGRSIFSRLHGVWSFGTLAGAALSTVAVAVGVGLVPQLGLTAFVAMTRVLRASSQRRVTQPTFPTRCRTCPTAPGSFRNGWPAAVPRRAAWR